MNPLAKIFGKKEKRASAKARDKPRKALEAAPRAYAPPRGRWLPIYRARADATLKGNEAIYAAVSRIANTMAAMPMHLYKGYELQEAHPLERIVGREPNVNFTPFGFVQTMEAFRNTEGNAYALIVPDKLGTVQRLDILDPTRVRPQRNQQTREMWYYIGLDDGKFYPVPGCMIIALHHMSANGEVGIRPLDVLASSLDYDRQVKELALNQLDGVNHGVMLTVPNSAIGPEERTRTVNDFLDAYERSGQRVVVLEGGLTATTFSESPVDPKLLDVERITRNRVATVYNLPPHMLGDYTDTKYSTPEQLMLEYLQMTIIPIVTQWEQEFNRKLLTSEDAAAGYCFRIDLDSITRADVVATAQKHQMAIRGGWMKPNDVRRREMLPPDPHGDELMASRDLLPLRVAVEHPEMLLGAGNAAKTAEEGEKK